MNHLSRLTRATFAALAIIAAGRLGGQQSLPVEVRRPAYTWAGLGPEWVNAPSVRLADDSQVFFRGVQFVIYSLREQRPVHSGDLRTWPNWPPAWNGITAAARFDADTIVLLNGGEWVPFSLARQGITGAPKPVTAWVNFPFPTVDAAVTFTPDSILFFHGTRFIRYLMSASGNSFDTAGDTTAWQGWPAHWNSLGGAVNPGDGFVYFFRGHEMLAYNLQTNSFHPVTQLPGAPAAAPTAPAPFPPQQAAPAAAPAPFPPQQPAPFAQPAPAPVAAPAPAPPPVQTPQAPQAPPGVSLLDLAGTGQQGVNAIANKLLVPRESGAIDFWMAPRWTPSADPNAPVRTVVRYGSTSRIGWAIFVTPNLDGIVFSNGEVQDRWDIDLQDGRLRHFAFITTAANGEKKTELFVDGRSLGPLPLGYAAAIPEAGLPFAIAPAPFAGYFGNLRVFNTAVNPRMLRQAGPSSIQDSRELMAFLDVRSPQSASFRLLPPAFRAEGVWARDGETLPQRNLSGGGDPTFVFKPQSLVYTRSLQGGGLLVVADPDPRMQPAAPQIARYAAAGRNQFTAQGATLAMQSNDEMLIGGQRYRRVDGIDAANGRPLKQETRMALGFERGNAIQSNLPSTEASYDIRRLHPWDYRQTGTQRRVFRNDDPAASEFKIQSNLNIPKGLHHVQESSADMTESGEAVTSARQYQQSALRGIGMSAEVNGSFKIVSASASFSMNAEFSKATTDMYSQSTARTLETRICRSYTLVLDRANATLHPEFVQAVQQLKNTRDYAGFIQTWGTHYPHAVIFGAKAVREAIVSKSFIEKQLQTTNSFEAAAKASLSVGVQGASFGGSVGMNGKQVDGSGRTESQGNDRTQVQMTALGHAGTFEAFACGTSSQIVPVHLDLRPLSELLAAPFFDDEAILTAVRPALEAELMNQLRNTAPPRADRVFDEAAYRRRLAMARDQAQRDADAKHRAENERGCGAQVVRHAKAGWKVYMQVSLPDMQHNQISQTYGEGKFSRDFISSLQSGGHQYVWWPAHSYRCNNGNIERVGGAPEFGSTYAGNANNNQPGMEVGPR